MNSGRLTKEGESIRNQTDEKNKGQERLIHTSGTLHGILGKLSLQFLHHGTLFVLCCATKEKAGFDGRITGCQTQAKACGYYKSLMICHV